MGTITASAIQVLGFVKEGGLWYAELPEFLEQGLGTREDLLMVDGSDTFLDILSGFHKKVSLIISPVPFDGYQCYMKKFRKGLNRELLDDIGHAPVNYGAYYQVHTLYGNRFEHQLWLCPVTEFVFGNYPEEIYTAVA